MEKLKQKLTEYGLAWRPAFDHSDFISVLDGEADTICRIYKHDGKYYLRYFGNYVYGCSDYSFDRVFDLVDHICIQMDAIEEPTKKMQNFISKLRTLVGSPDFKIIWLDYAKPRIRIDCSDGASICTVNITDDHKINISYYYPFWNPNYGGFKQNMVYNHLRIAAEGIRNRYNYYIKGTIKLVEDTKNDVKIDINVDKGAVDSMVYAYMARGNGKSQFAMTEMFKKMQQDKYGPFAISDVIFNDPATIVFWADGTKTVVKCQKGETFDPEKGLAMAIAKKIYGGKHNYYEVFAKHVGRYNKKQKKEEEKEKILKFVEDKTYYDPKEE